MRNRFHILLTILTLLLLPATAQADTFDDTLSAFERYATKGMKDWKIPGMAIAVVKDNAIVYAKGFGTKRYGTDRPVDKNTVFQVGSTTKAFTVALVATLVDQGVLGWDDRVVDHFPSFRLHDPWVTREFRIHDLFAQHSGMPPYAGDLQAFIGFDRDHIIRSMQYIEPVYSFRDKFSYVNNLFVAGAKVAELATGRTWEELMQERILTPLRMDRSTMDAAGLTDLDNASTLHVLADGKPLPIENDSPLLIWPYVYGPAGGLNSSAVDMARWVAAQLHDGLGATRIFSEAAADYMHSPLTPINAGGIKGGYCQGWLYMPLKKTNVVWHNGGTTGINSFVGFSKDLGMGVVVLTNLGGHKLADALGLQFFEMMSGNTTDWNGKFLAEKRAAEEDAENEDAVPSLPGLPLDAYAGKYRSPVYGDLTVYAEKGHLLVRLASPIPFDITVTHTTMHTFAGEWARLDPGDPEYHFDFSVDTDGDVTALTIREFNTDGVCVFERQ